MQLEKWPETEQVVLVDAENRPIASRAELDQGLVEHRFGHVFRSTFDGAKRLGLTVRHFVPVQEAELC